MFYCTEQMKNYFLFIVYVFLLSSCQKWFECDDCFTPPPQFLIEFVDKNSGENLYSIGTYDFDSFEINGSDNEDVSWSFVSENNMNLVDISDIGWILGFHTYTLQLSAEQSVMIDIDMARKTNDCCTYFQVNKFDVRYYDFNQSNTTGIITIEL